MNPSPGNERQTAEGSNAESWDPAGGVIRFRISGSSAKLYGLQFGFPGLSTNPLQKRGGTPFPIVVAQGSGPIFLRCIGVNICPMHSHVGT